MRVTIEEYKRTIRMNDMRYRMGGELMVARGLKKDLRKKELMKKHLSLAGQFETKRTLG